jgi:hypothetical protein
MIIGLSIPSCVASSDDALEALIEAMLELVVLQNVEFFKANPDAPCCLDCGTIRYREPAFSDRTIFASAEDVLRLRETGCGAAAAYVAAKARTKGVLARAVVDRTAPRDYHAVVLYPDGSIEDPTANLPS